MLPNRVERAEPAAECNYRVTWNMRSEIDSFMGPFGLAECTSTEEKNEIILNYVLSSLAARQQTTNRRTNIAIRRPNAILLLSCASASWNSHSSPSTSAGIDLIRFRSSISLNGIEYVFFRFGIRFYFDGRSIYAPMRCSFDERRSGREVFLDEFR